MKLLIFLIGVGALVSFETSSQGNSVYNSPNNTAIIPPPPNAASLGKFGDIPVNNYTGIPSISIPITQVTSGKLSMAISLDYHAGGIKVEEIASWVGLGWSLNAGGVITRTVRGIPDDYSSAYGDYYSVDNYISTRKSQIEQGNTEPATSELNELYSEIINGRADTEADLYFFNFGSNSGRFFEATNNLTGYRQYTSIPQRNLKIEKITDGVSSQIIRWELTTEDGVKYSFGKNATHDGVEKNYWYSVDLDQLNGNWLGAPYNSMIASWYLIEIKHPDGWTITFDYEPYNYSFRTFGSEISYKRIIQSSNEVECGDRFKFVYMRNEIEAKRLKRINFLNGKVEFDVREKFRADLCEDHALEYIKIFKNNESNPWKNFWLDYGYFKSNGSPSPVEQNQPSSSDLGFPYRLKLISVTEQGLDGSKKPPYLVEYNETQNLPPRVDPQLGLNGATSFGQDYWGFFNGETLNRREGNVLQAATLVPTYFADLSGQGNLQEYTMANRSVRSNYAKANIIKKITFPTGGYTQFDFESNSVLSNQIPDETPFDSHSKTSPQAHLNSTSSEIGKTASSSLFTVNSSLVATTNVQNQVPGAFVTVHIWEQGPCGLNPPVVSREIWNATTNQIVFANGSLPDKATVFLPNGQYYIKLTREPGSCNSDFYCQLAWNEYASGHWINPVNVDVGGLRIAKITTNDGNGSGNEIVKVFKYNKLNDVSQSSGRLVGFPDHNGYVYTESRIECRQTPSGGTYNLLFDCGFYVKQSSSNYPLSTTQGAPVGYKNVTIEFGNEAEGGKTEYTYYTSEEYPDDLFTQFPFPPPNSKDYWRGLLIKEVNYKKNSTGYIKVSEQDLNYNSSLYQQFWGTKFGFQSLYVNHSCGLPLGETYGFSIQKYFTTTEFVFLESSLTTIYNDAELPSLTKNESFVYGDHMQLKSQNLVASDEIVRTTYYKTPLDYSGISASPSGISKGIKLLQDNHIIDPIIEMYTTKGIGSSELLTGGRLFSFIENPINSNLVVQDKYFKMELSSPILLSDYNPSTIDNDNFIFDTYLVKPRTNSHFDSRGNLLDTQKIDDMITSYKWGYVSSLPVVEIINAISTEFFYENFEEGTGIEMSNSHTGEFCLSGDFLCAFTIPNSRNYIIEYWYRNENEEQWHLFRENYSNNMLLNLGDFIDDIRIYPMDAQMRSFTYIPGIGMTSTIDEKGQVFSYEYDAFGRLQLIKDDKGNILKTYQYHYKNQN